MTLATSEPLFTVAPGEAHDITLTLTASTAGEISGTLKIISNDPDSPTEIAITGYARFHISDVSGNGSVSAYDAALILQFVVGVIDRFPVEEVVGSSPENVVPRDYEVSIPQVSLKSGQRVFVPIHINDLSAVPAQAGATGLVAGGITLKYDATVLRAIDVTFPIRQSYWEANTNLNGEIRFAFVNANADANVDKLLLVEFEALPNSEGKTSALILDDVQLSESLSIKRINGLVTVSPSEFRLRQNYPNPFNPETWIPYNLASDANVEITIYNVQGHRIRTLSLGTQPAGSYLTKDRAAHWDGRSDTGELVSSGIYLYHLQVSEAIPHSGAGEFRATRKMIILK